MCFRSFVLGSSSEEATPEELVVKYRAYEEEHRRHCAEKFWTAYCSSGLLQDLFHENHLIWAADWKRRHARAALAHFLTSLDEGAFKDVSLTADRSSIKNLQPTLSIGCGLSTGDIAVRVGTAPHFLMEHDCFSFIVKNVPPTLSASQFCDFVGSQPGLKEAMLEPAKSGTVLRVGYARFGSETELSSAMKDLHGRTIEGGYKLQPAKVLVKDVHKVVLVPNFGPERLARDSELALKLIVGLDAAVDLSPVETEQATAKLVAAAQVSGVQDVAKLLDLCVLYLRHVHNCCFYTGIWCDSGRELGRRCGLMSLRIDAGDILPEAWAEGHAARLCTLEGCMAQSMRPTSTAPGLEDPEISALWEQHISSVVLVTEDAAGQKTRCKECNKLFKSDEYVKKHVGKVHGKGCFAAVTPMVEMIKQERMRKAFFADHNALREAQVALFSAPHN